MARDAAGGVKSVEGRVDRAGVTLIAALYTFYQEHERCGELDSAVDGDRVWMACTCSAMISRNAKDDRPTRPASASGTLLSLSFSGLALRPDRCIRGDKRAMKRPTPWTDDATQTICQPHARPGGLV
jgi:hypothetical protein